MQQTLVTLLCLLSPFIVASSEAKTDYVKRNFNTLTKIYNGVNCMCFSALMFAHATC